MLPLELVAFFLHVVGHSLVARLRILIAYINASAVAIALVVIAGRRQHPRTLGVDVTENLQVPLVAHGEIIAALTQIESTG